MGVVIVVVLVIVVMVVVAVFVVVVVVGVVAEEAKPRQDECQQYLQECSSGGEWPPLARYPLQFRAT